MYITNAWNKPTYLVWTVSHLCSGVDCCPFLEENPHYTGMATVGCYHQSSWPILKTYGEELPKWLTSHHKYARTTKLQSNACSYTCTWYLALWCSYCLHPFLSAWGAVMLKKNGFNVKNTNLGTHKIWTMFHTWNTIDAFTIEVWWNFDKMQIIFKVITGSSGHALWWERTVLYSMETLFDTGLVALESISPWKDIYYGMLRCRTLSFKENFSHIVRLCGFCNRFFSCPYSAALCFPPRAMIAISCYRFEYNLHLIKTLSHLNRESMYR